jgi:hypothetical protein
MMVNMPDEVFEIYLVPLILTDGWPFKTLDSPTFGVWWDYFDHHTVKQISQLTWERNEIPFSLYSFHQVAKDRIHWIIGAHIYGRSTPCANIEDGKNAFFQCPPLYRTYATYAGAGYPDAGLSWSPNPRW